jgi:hypothetical protein
MHSIDLVGGNRGPFLVVVAMVVMVVDFCWQACLFGGALKDYTESSIRNMPNILTNNGWGVV